ncbi:MAG: 2-oxo acid dehydrogenase subunit E2 [Candidatus Marinimicrobia bacterium]|nr:2-oxo acid dehydrogenase subunit E2 [Candidatus Neomarinimicrobiota bacterium]MCF7850583.1 2-oxo acid dehydrogenase subunit E2 [Candidatus Neomarinimicrobiota bacterium]MCF7903683.1 2-oxo acid dehydrogenase subunit E2 [Candidatus Neomarinimicrobiota bacterium]
MPFRWRPDGKFVKNLPLTRRIMPFLMHSRTESVVYYEQHVEVEKTWQYVDEFRKRSGLKASILHFIIWRAAQVLEKRPDLNRFVAGRRIFQRDGIWVSFSMKKEMTDDAPLVVVKKKIDPSWTFEETVRHIQGGIEKGRRGGKSTSDVEMGLVFALPYFMVSAFTWLLRGLNHFGLLPKFFIDGDELYGSLFIANLGSIGLQPAYHHLYNWGNIPIFMALGTNEPRMMLDDRGRPAVKDMMTIRYSFDERINDGFYSIKALELLKELVENPEMEIDTNSDVPLPEEAPGI